MVEVKQTKAERLRQVNESTLGGRVIDGLAGAGGMGRPPPRKAADETMSYERAREVMRGMVDAEEAELQRSGKPNWPHAVVAVGGLVVYAILIYWLLTSEVLREKGAYG